MKRNPELDAVRGLAALIICLFHMYGHDSVFRAGWSMVDLFFVLSGYLINAIMIRNAHQPGFLWNFYARRSLRIWPIYYLTLMAMVAASPFLPWLISLRGLPYYLTYTQFVPRYWGGEMPPFTVLFQHTWTLAIEEQFYIIWPALILLLGTRRLGPVAVVTLLISLSCRLAGLDHWLLLARCDGLAFGAILAVIFSKLPEATDDAARPRLRAGFSLACLISGGYLIGYAALFEPKYLHHDGPLAFSIFLFALGYFGLIGLVVLEAGRPWLAPLRSRPLVELGKISYGLYLYHIPVIWAVNAVAIRSPLKGSPVVPPIQLAATIAVAVVSWRLVEAPILSLKSRFEYRGGDTPPREPAGGPGTD